jgi:hypothetical protein
MAGGLFGKPFVLNEKCIVFALICMGLFLYKPDYKNEIVLYISLFILFVLAYVAMAWYDFIFNCQLLPLKKGYIGGITALFKPGSHNKDKQEKHNETLKDTKLKKIIIYLSHLIFIVPLLVYIAIFKNNVNKMIYPLLGATALFTALYHGIHLIFMSH